jgi:hypothetical protein
VHVCHPSYGRKHKKEYCLGWLRHISIITRTKRTGGMAQVAELLTSNREPLSSNAILPKIIKEEEEEIASIILRIFKL